MRSASTRHHHHRGHGGHGRARFSHATRVRWGLAFLAILALFIASWLGLRRRGHGATPDGAAVAVQQAGRPDPRLRAARPPALSRAQPGPDVIPAPATPGTGPGPYLHRYGGRSGRLAAGMKPAPAFPVTKIESSASNPSLQVWVPSLRATAAGTTVFARIADDGPAAVVSSAQVAVAPAGTTPQDFSAMQAQAGGAEFRKSFVPPALDPADAQRAPPRQYRYLVVLRGSRNGEPFERQAGGLFFVHDARAQLDPASVAVAPPDQSDGDLLVRLQAKLERPGTYFVYAELWGGQDGAGQQAIAFARERLSGVSAGDRAIELRFGGAIVRDSGIDGPYVVRNLRLQQVDTHPAHEVEPIAALPPTPPWRSSMFH